MRARILRYLPGTTAAALLAISVLVAVPGPIGVFATDPSPLGEQKQTTKIAANS